MSLLSDLWNQQYITKPIGSTKKGPMPYTVPAITGPIQTPYVPVSKEKVFTGGTQTSTVTAPPTNTTTATQPAVAEDLYAKYRDPKTGKIMSPEEYAVYIGNKIPTTKVSGDVGQYAGDVLTGGLQSASELERRAREMNNARNDIATGATDPYKAASKSGVAYSPTELAAIEKAYAGVYDPALQDVFSKLSAKQKEDALAETRKFELEKLAKQHEYAMAEKTATAGGGVDSSAGYIPGADPIVDSYIQRINNGELATDIFRSIPGVNNQALRNKISQGIAATKYESAKAKGSLDTVNKLNQLLLNPKLSYISGFVDKSGISSLWGEAATAKALYNQINSKVQLIGTAELAKGQGAISDYERSLFANAATSANRGLSDAEFRKELINLRGALSLASGLTVSMKLTDPKTGESRTYDLDRDGVIAAERSGLLVESVDDVLANK